MKKILRQFLEIINKFIPKNEHSVVIVGGKNKFIEPNVIELANYISANSKKKIVIAINKALAKNIYKHVSKDVEYCYTPSFRLTWLLLTSKYIFTTSGTFIHHYCKQQIFVNVGHGAGHKKIRKLISEELPGVDADITVATSDMIKIKFAKAFGVNEKDVYITGYPRNDLMLRYKSKTEEIKHLILDKKDWNKVIIWLPTFRKNFYNKQSGDGIEKDNPFQIEEFSVATFNEMLKKTNTVCIIKPHPSSKQNYDYSEYCNIKILTDDWLFRNGLTLYHILPISDILITDFSSVMIDYLLLDKPIICFSTDYNQYRDSRGFYFNNLEEMLPSKLYQDKDEFSEYLSILLQTNIDIFIDKRLKIKNLYFKHQDDKSSNRLLNITFNPEEIT